MAYERDSVRRAPSYTPGEQLDGGKIIKLNTNENPYPPSPTIRDALANFDVSRLRVYPPPNAMEFRQAAASVHGVDPEQIIATNGGDELLRLAIATFVEPGETIGLCAPTYSLYAVLATVHGAKTLEVALNDDWSLSGTTAAVWNDAQAKLAFVVNPHAPSGHLLSVQTIANLADAFHGVLVVDEAYIDFVAPQRGYDVIPLLSQHDNILILRTLSKGYSLAGLRFGYGIGSAPVIDPMASKTKDSYNTDTVSQVLACAAMSSQAYAADTWSQVRNDRESLRTALLELDIVTEPSETNFVLATIPAPHSAKNLYESLREREILVRYFSAPRLHDKLRITVGTPEQNQALLKALTQLMG
ncbi:MAG: histidinol-phosphate transaminase [Gammaproteobacteria bacterium]|nr:histidinol-phosphate transaminase [Gammaproteobacteria bacterium]